MTLDRSRPARLLSHAMRSVEVNGWRATLAHFYQRLFSSLNRNGLTGTIERTVREAPEGTHPRASPKGTGPQASSEAPHPFDLRHGTDTSGFIPSSETIPGFVSSTFARGYLGIAPSALIQAISQLPLQLEDFTFIDLGCGKGRALMVAAQFPFRHIQGVELSPQLCRVANANLAIDPAWAARITVIEQNAARVTLPDSPLVIFLYNPFLPPVLRRVLANLQHQLRRHPRETWLIYAEDPHFAGISERFPFLRQIAESDYQLSPEDQAAMGQTHERITLYSAALTR